MCWICSVLGGCFCIYVTVSGICTCELCLQNLQFLAKLYKLQRYGNFAKYELYLINLVSCRNKRPLEVGIINVLNFSVDICCHGDCKIGFG